jgi:hypothetical protein
MRSLRVEDGDLLGGRNVSTALLILFAFCVVAGLVATVAFVARSRRRPGVGTTSRETGALLVPPAPPRSVDATGRRFIGGGLLRGRFGLTKATAPLAELAIARGGLTLRFRPEPLVRVLFGVSPLTLAPGTGVIAFPARGWMARYVGFATNGVVAGYFNSSRPEELLGLLSAAGFAVDWAEKKVQRV